MRTERPMHTVQRKGQSPTRVPEGRIVLLVSGARTGKTTLARAWVAEKPDKRARVEDGPDGIRRVRELVEQGIDVAYEALVMPDNMGLRRRAVQTITDPTKQRIEI